MMEKTESLNLSFSIFVLFFSISDAVDCEYIETESTDTALLTVAYGMAGTGKKYQISKLD